MTSDRPSVGVLQECAELQRKKGADYQNSASRVRQADHYLRGVDTIYDMLHQKMLRALSLLETARVSYSAPNFESIEDTFKDIINYSSFAVVYIRGEMDGQSPDRDMFNRPVVKPKVDPLNEGVSEK